MNHGSVSITKPYDKGVKCKTFIEIVVDSEHYGQFVGCICSAVENCTALH